jgi:hypothetical protein
MLTEPVILAPIQTEDHENTLNLIFQQDGTSAHTASGTQEWFQNNSHSFAKDTWPPNSPDLSPIESTYLGHHQGKGEYVKPSARDFHELQQSVENCWKKIDLAKSDKISARPHQICH